jgi:hypothetical protein
MTDQIAHTIGDAARRSTICRTSIFAAIKAGQLRAHKIGKRTVILDEDLRSWLSASPVSKPELVA